MAPKKKRSSVEEQRQQKHVWFTKRRQGLFRKAAKLCVICDAQIAIVMLSEAGNPYAFGHPSADEILHHHLHRTNPVTWSISDRHGDQTKKLSEIVGNNQKYKQSLANYEEENKIMDVKDWIEKSFEACHTVEELGALKEKYMALLDNIKKRFLQKFDFDRVEKAGDHSFMSASINGGGMCDHNCFNAPGVLNGMSYPSLVNFEGVKKNIDCDGFDRFGMKYANEDLYDVVREARSCKLDSLSSVDSTGGGGGHDASASYVNFQRQPPLLSTNHVHVFDKVGSEHIHKELANGHHQSEGLYSNLGCFPQNVRSISSEKPVGF
ncbi:hypothetical protein FNV43_RR23648 [Rhamnella rubrinervis]|uniref:MADS-box domain-containing protein n=1 Tax=Rhamnella rubrinervis TaxID=2594499 RepID=A0A8K0GT59_9ROSA|nr:hypothetical protein FNV43_RR23648 [Rhamnella rubrinervis]